MCSLQVSECVVIFAAARLGRQARRHHDPVRRRHLLGLVVYRRGGQHDRGPIQHALPI